MKHLFNLFLPIAFLFSAGHCLAQNGPAENVILITFDGLRWEELYGGADDSLTFDARFVGDSEALAAEFRAPTPEERREKLMPFFWGTVAKEGMLLGNRWHDNKVDLTNTHWFSYPGYNEILTGAADPRINSNDKVPNPNVTVLEYLNQQPDLKGKVAAFGSWDVFPYIVNEARSGVPVNAGYAKAEHDGLSEREKFLNELQDEIPKEWGGVRFDAFTHHFALEYLKKFKPRVVYIAYGETDDWAHGGHYDKYLIAARRTDQYIKELWEFAQSDPQYRGKTTFLITTDHGRGDNPKSDWTGHGSRILESQAVWTAAMGPGIPALGEVKEAGQHYQSQMAKTVAWLLGYDYDATKDAGEVLDMVEGE